MTREGDFQELIHALKPVRETYYPAPQAMEQTLREYQKAGYQWMRTLDSMGFGGILADDMGLGKTVQALAFLCATKAYPALICAPPHLLTNWRREIDRFLGPAIRVHVLRGLTPHDLPEGEIYLTHYLLLRGWKEALPKMGFRTVIFDEMQELRHAGTEKYSAASLVSSAAENVVGLSGTPIYNHGGEIWNVINVLDFHFLGDWESFSREWC